MTVAIEPAAALRPMALLERGAIRRRHARAIVANLPESIARRELRVVKDKLGWAEDDLEVAALGGTAARGPGNVLMLELESEHVTELYTGFGEPNVRAEAVAQRAVDEVRDYLTAGVPVGPYLADQLIVPLALAGGGSFRTGPLSRHAASNMAVIRDFLGTAFDVAPSGDHGAVTVHVRSRA